ncbi:TlpA disulfide reductase family protein [Wenxinia marina]|uniref:Thiol-disulfide isomerase and thioredoxin n=1 Tax=Wenxinia marina DSM 24838 TaxID=1123501 RepID=A0A0D0QH05_9RHOB|nr:TlpA disulfide reductase family protein [Wenxinia marina]KIQ70323.1 Thiol-disulfide isomerase and thioredoxin [Wenxinia marina DSM 24838]GGL54024.1 thioredoxin [Wenxinia marina]
MRRIVVAAVYTGGLALANAGAAQLADVPLEGDMRKLTVHDAPMETSDTPFTLQDGGEATLADFAGTPVVLNLWATWCAPCREEMPTLEALAEEAGDDLTVLTVATGRNSPEGMAAFFDEIGVENLPLHTDPRQAFARDLGVLGLPVTILIDAEGHEVARLQGEADWSAPEAAAVIAALTAD